MTKTSSRLLRTFRDLVLALLNATLILVAICLFLGLRLATTVDGLTGTFAENLVSVQPLRDDVQAMTREVAALRQDLDGLRSQTGTASSEAAQALNARLAALDARLEDMRMRAQDTTARIDAIVADPMTFVEQAARVTSTELIDGFAALRGCTPSDGMEPSTPAVTN